MSKEFSQISWDAALIDDCRQIIRLAVREDLGRTYDWTTASLVSGEARGQAAIVARESGVIAGLPAVRLVLDEMEIEAQWSPQVLDGAVVEAQSEIAHISCPARDLLTAERLMLNLLGHLSGVATLTRQYVEAVSGAKAKIYDTRKTTPGWRRLEKYAVRCGGGHNHRTGLYDAILIKDNHLAFRAAMAEGASPADAIEAAREFLHAMTEDEKQAEEMIIEIEVDTLKQLDEVLPARPDIVLLDNMTPDLLREAVSRRDASGLPVQLEASGGINLQTVRQTAECGVDRISVGALTHSAVSLDLGLDWRAQSG